MAKMIQLRHVPDELHRTLKQRAEQEGLSLSDFLLREARRVAEQPSAAELRERLRRRSRVRTKVSPTRAVRNERERA